MGCSGVLTHRYFDSALDKKLSSNFTAMFDSDIGITPSQQELSIFTILKAMAGSCGVNVNDSNLDYKFNFIDSNKEYIDNQDIKCDLQIVVEYFGASKKYARYSHAFIKNINPENKGAYIKQAVNNFVSSLIYSDDAVNKVTNWRIKSGNVTVHLGTGSEPTPEAINLFNGLDTEGYIWDTSVNHFVENSDYGFCTQIPVQNGTAYNFSTTMSESGTIYIIGWAETSPDTYVYKSLLLNYTGNAGTYENEIIIPADVTHIVINMKLTNTSTFFGAPISD